MTAGLTTYHRNVPVFDKGHRKYEAFAAVQQGTVPQTPVPEYQPEISDLADDELTDYILQGPLLHACGIDPASVRGNLERWRSYADALQFTIGAAAAGISLETQRTRAYQYYLPVFFWAQEQLRQHKKHSNAPLVLGMNAPQGCGKTTLVEELENLFRATGNTAAAVSIDDFYLSYENLQALGKANPDNRLLQMRGNAGSHDLQLARDTLEGLRNATDPKGQVAVPRYNKSAYQGKGDRVPKSEWPCVKGPLDVVLFEGWMLGYAPRPEAEVAAIDKDLITVNKHLEGYKQSWDTFVDAWIVIQVADPGFVRKWRLEAEQRMRAKGKPGMSDEEVLAFVDTYMPAYKAYLPNLYTRGPSTARKGHLLMCEIDEKRCPVAEQPEPIDLSSKY